jgi:hypothetical protein
MQVVRKPISKQIIHLQENFKVDLKVLTKTGSDGRGQAYHALKEFCECRLTKYKSKSYDQCTLFWFLIPYNLWGRF